MNKTWSWVLPLVVVTAGLTLASAAQTSDESGQLRPVDQVGDAPELVPLAATFDAERWKADLSSADFAARRHAMQLLAAEARASVDARDALESWAAGDDACLAWTAYLTLEEARTQPQPVTRDPLEEFFGFGHGRRVPLGTSPFGHAFFGRDPFAVQDLMREMQESLDRLPPGASQHSQGLSIQSGPDGVKVERRSMVDGDETIETFEAESMEKLLELHPELRDELQLQPIQGGEDEMRSLLDRLRMELDLPSSALHPGKVRTDVLGVMMREADAWQGRVDGLEPGTGLLVERVLPGTIAEAVGIRAGDIIASLNALPMRTAADVRTALNALSAGDDLEIEWFDRRGEKRTRTYSN